MAKRRRAIRIVERKLGRHRAWGRYSFVTNADGSRNRVFTPIIEIDPRQTPKDELDTVIHEGLHHSRPELTEEEVIAAAADITEILWAMGFRRARV